MSRREAAKRPGMPPPHPGGLDSRRRLSLPITKRGELSRKRRELLLTYGGSEKGEKSSGRHGNPLATRGEPSSWMEMMVDSPPRVEETGSVLEWHGPLEVRNKRT